MTNDLVEFRERKDLVKELMELPHYRKMGDASLMAIVEKAKALGISPFDALNGGLYAVQGRIEMSAAMMNSLIRARGHSITKDSKSDETICILHGKRADTGDTWRESFSLEDAKLAGLLGKGPWKQYPKDMLFSRALSRLARQLFSDVIAGCYIEGELKDSSLKRTDSGYLEDATIEPVEIVEPTISYEQLKELTETIGADHDLLNRVEGFCMEKFSIANLSELPASYFPTALARIKASKEV